MIVTTVKAEVATPRCLRESLVAEFKHCDKPDISRTLARARVVNTRANGTWNVVSDLVAYCGFDPDASRQRNPDSLMV